MNHNGLQTDAQRKVQPDFRAASMIFDKHLYDENVNSMKFLCHGLVEASKLELIQEAHELIDLLQSANHVTEKNYSLLADLLQFIGRIDVLQKIGSDEMDVMVNRFNGGSKINPFYVLLFKLAKELPDEDVQKATCMYGKVPKSQKVLSGIDLLTVMVQHQAVRPDNVSLLTTIFGTIGRQDIVELINRYTETQGISVMDDLEQTFIKVATLLETITGTVYIHQPQLPPRKGFGEGLGPPIQNSDESDRREPGFSTPVSGFTSMANQPPSVHHPPSPSALPLSIPATMEVEEGVPPAAQHPELPGPPPVVHGTFSSTAPEGFDRYAIPWKVLDVLSRNIPKEYWPEFVYRLGVPLSHTWDKRSTDHNHNLALLRRWLDLQETQAMDEVSVKVLLVQALNAAGPALMANEIATFLNIDFAAAVQQSVSSEGSSVYDTNDVASAASEAPASLQPAVNPSSAMATVAAVAPVTRGMEQLSLNRNPIPHYHMDRLPRAVVQQSVSSEGSSVYDTNDVASAAAVQQDVAPEGSPVHDTNNVASADAVQQDVAPEGSPVHDTNNVASADAVQQDVAPEGSPVHDTNNVASADAVQQDVAPEGSPVHDTNNVASADAVQQDVAPEGSPVHDTNNVASAETQGISVMDDLEQTFIKVATLLETITGTVYIHQPQLPPRKGFGEGLGPPIQNSDESDRREPGFSTPVSGFTSMANQPPSVHHPPSPSALPLSIPATMEVEEGVPPAAQHPELPGPPPVVHGTFSSTAPEGFDRYAIPWKVLDVLSRNIPKEYWPEFVYRLGVPLSHTWDKRSTDHNHNLALLRRWLDLQETQAMDEVSVKVLLVQALNAAGPALMANEIATFLNIDFAAAVQQSVSSEGSSVYDTNDVASAASEAPASLQPAVNPSSAMATVAAVAPVTRGMEQLSLNRNPIPHYHMDRLPRAVVQQSVSSEGSSVYDTNDVASAAAVQQDVAPEGSPVHDTNNVASADAVQQDVAPEGSPVHDTNNVASADAVQQDVAPEGSPVHDTNNVASAETQGISVMDDLEQTTLHETNVGNILVPQPQVPPSKGLGPGLGPSIHDCNVSDRREPGLSTPESGFTSMANQPPSVHPHPSPSAPPPSLPATTELEEVVPSAARYRERSGPPPVVHGTFSRVVPEGFDRYAIPWKVLDVLSRNIPKEDWPEFVYRLGLPLPDTWYKRTTDHNHNLVWLKWWLDLPETQAMDEMSVKVWLVQALNAAGPALMASEIAGELNIDFAAAVQKSVSFEGSSVYHTNHVASTATVAAVAPVTRGMEQLNLNRNPIPHYRMDRLPRGKCVIINNRDFYKDTKFAESKQMIAREGTDIDRDKLQTTFARLNFDVIVHDNSTHTEMLQLIQTVAIEDHSGFDCFVCCILTHGVQGALYGVNGMTLPIWDLTAPLRSQACPSLSGKPKLFFMQACQGHEKQEGHTDMQMDNDVETDGPGNLIPNESDFLLGYATVPGFVSYRSKMQGSWYITKLTEVLNKYAYDHDILDILTLVNYEVSKSVAMIEGGQYKQSPAPMYSLTRKFIFRAPPGHSISARVWDCPPTRVEKDTLQCA